MQQRDFSYIDKNLAKIKERINAAAKSEKAAADVTVLAAVKNIDAETINYLHQKHNITDFGENRVQELLSKYEDIEKDGKNLHFIGKLQKNKVKYIVDKVSMIHSLDSISLAQEINKRAAISGRVIDALVEINIGKEDTKGGIFPEYTDDFIDKLSVFKNIRVCGIMTMAPKCREKTEYRKYFRETYRIFIDISQKKLHNIDRPVLSMGMSDNYDLAVEEGSNLVRIGSALFSG